MKQLYILFICSFLCLAPYALAQDAQVIKTVEITGKYILGTVTTEGAPPTDEELARLTLAFAKQHKSDIIQVGWFIPKQKKGYKIAAVAESIDKVNVSIIRPVTASDEVRLEKMLAYPTSPAALTNHYLENEVVADDDFQGKTIVFESSVAEIAKGAFNQPYVFFPDDVGSDTGLTCYFEAKSPEIRRIRKGSQVLVRGTVKGFLMQDVILERCEIIQIR